MEDPNYQKTINAFFTNVKDALAKRDQVAAQENLTALADFLGRVKVPGQGTPIGKTMQDTIIDLKGLLTAFQSQYTETSTWQDFKKAVSDKFADLLISDASDLDTPPSFRQPLLEWAAYLKEL